MKFKIKRKLRIGKEKKPYELISTTASKRSGKELWEEIEARRKAVQKDKILAADGVCPLCKNLKYLNVLIRHQGIPELLCMACALAPDFRNKLKKKGWLANNKKKVKCVKVNFG